MYLQDMASVEGASRDPGLLQPHSVAHCQEVSWKLSWELSGIQSQCEARVHDDVIVILLYHCIEGDVIMLSCVKAGYTALKVMSSCSLM